MAANVKVLQYIGAGPKSIRTAKAHVKYMEANREHHRNKPHLFTAKEDKVKRQPFFRRLEQQKLSPKVAVMHKFVITLSEEERDRLKIDLQQLARDTMARLETKLNQRLDWVAAVHDDRGHPHVHIAVRGRDMSGRPVYIGQPEVRALRKWADQEKLRQAERNLGKERANEINRELQEKAREIKGGKSDPDHAYEPRNPFVQEVPREQSRSVAGDFLRQLSGVVDQIIRDAEREREQARHRAIREAKKKQKEKGRGR